MESNTDGRVNASARTTRRGHRPWHVRMADLFASAFDVYQAPGTTVYQLSSNLYAEDNTIQAQLYATAISTGYNLSTATAGSTNIFLMMSKSG